MDLCTVEYVASHTQMRLERHAMGNERPPLVCMANSSDLRSDMRRIGRGCLSVVGVVPAAGGRSGLGAALNPNLHFLLDKGRFL
ncbi:MAG: hypothetical protein IJ340_10305 [Odoribacter sp.]|nr:hypothetical protein [Odoribacter sp.]